MRVQVKQKNGLIVYSGKNFYLETSFDIEILDFDIEVFYNLHKWDHEIFKYQI